ncbi:hypothetical protein [Hymenobacter pini]|nr:hypothetical protein [Hymenobacter pini]MCA8830185.1 hypothetical protein [Hymenobacter pini]
MIGRLLLALAGLLLATSCRVCPPTVAGHVSRYGAANTPTKHFKPNRRI